MQRLAKGSLAKIGSRSLKISWANDVNEQCRPNYSSEDHLIFAVEKPTGYSFLTDCYSESVPVKNNQYQYKNQSQASFKFFDVNPLSAQNGLTPLYADELAEEKAKSLAKEALFQNTEFKKYHLKDIKHWQAKGAKILHDQFAQPYWQIEIAFDPPRAKGEFYLVKFYNSLRESFQIPLGNNYSQLFLSSSNKDLNQGKEEDSFR